MNRLETRLNQQRPAIAVPITETVTDEVIADIPNYCDVFELRVDKFSDTSIECLTQKAEQLGALLPVILTMRTQSEGGDWSDQEDDRQLEVAQEMITMVDGVDTRIYSTVAPAIVKLAKAHKKTPIGSYHNLTETPLPNNLKHVVHRARRLGVHFCKIATMAKKQEELERLTEVVINANGTKMIAVAMGEFGPVSRIALPLLGSKLTFASADANAVVPGQLGYRETRAILDTVSPYR